MIYHRLVALFARYCQAHLSAAGKPVPLFGSDGQRLGNIDRISLQGLRLKIEGWSDCDQISLSHAGKTSRSISRLHRPDVTAAFSDLQTHKPGFAVDLPRGEGPVVMCLKRGYDQFLYQLPTPDRRTIRRARVRLIMPFLRDLTRALPAILHWLATHDPADRASLKKHLRLTAAGPARVMQPLLFLSESLAHLPAKQRDAERARLQPAALGQCTITLILPVYNALDLLPEVLRRILAHTDLPWRMILIEDASSDSAVRPFVENWCNTQNATHPGRITMIWHANNQGFIRSVNEGLKLALPFGDHVVLLNSDAFVPQGWATRLMRPFLTHDRVATVTPMSNDAEILSAPVICQRTPLQHGEADAIDAVAARIHPDAGLADAPTGVGFCMAMSIDYLRKLPQLDVAFGRGYGEEVDWCQKARALGGRHLGLANLFVEHRGGSSFGQPEKQRLVAQNGAVISKRYPSYDTDVHTFISDDPLCASRLALAIAWAGGRATGALPVYIAHSLGGGAEDYLSQRISRDMPKAALVIRVGGACRWQVELHTPHGMTRGGTDTLALIQTMLSPVAQLNIVYSCAVGDANPLEVPQAVLALRRGPQDRIEMLIHDYFPISPTYTLLNNEGRYVGLPAVNGPTDTLRQSVDTFSPLTQWQGEWGKLVQAADRITLFSANSAQIFGAAYPAAKDKLRVVAHVPLVDLPRVQNAARGQPRVIGVLGNIGLAKGAVVLQNLARWSQETGHAKLVVLGNVDPDYPLGQIARIHGGYNRADIPALIARYGITDWLIPSIWPETFSYTTHEAIATGLPVWGFDLGAQGEAIQWAPNGQILPIPDGVPDLSALFAAFAPARRNTESAAA